MRLITVKSPNGSADDIARIAFSVGIADVTVQQARNLHAAKPETIKDIVNIETSTPTAKKFIDALINAPFFNREEYSIAVKQPRSIISSEKLSNITRPLVEPTIDILEELWQFSHVTFGFVGRILIGAFLLAYGMIQFKLLFMIAGLLFIPLLPPMLAMGFGIWTRQFRLAAQGILAFVVAIVLLLCGGVVVALMTNPPLLFNESNSLLAGLLISLAVGVAAGLATADDVGRREMIGLAATAQVAILPVWFGNLLGLRFSNLGESSAYSPRDQSGCQRHVYCHSFIHHLCGFGDEAREVSQTTLTTTNNSRDQIRRGKRRLSACVCRNVLLFVFGFSMPRVLSLNIEVRIVGSNNGFFKRYKS